MAFKREKKKKKKERKDKEATSKAAEKQIEWGQKATSVAAHLQRQNVIKNKSQLEEGCKSSQAAAKAMLAEPVSGDVAGTETAGGRRTAQ